MLPLTANQGLCACPPLEAVSLRWLCLAAVNSVKFVGESASVAIDLEAAKARAAKQKITNFFGAAKPRSTASKPIKGSVAAAADNSSKGAGSRRPASSKPAQGTVSLDEPSSGEEFAEADPVLPPGRASKRLRGHEDGADSGRGGGGGAGDSSARPAKRAAAAATRATTRSGAARVPKRGAR